MPIEKLIVVPAFLNPFKKTSEFDAQIRMQWLLELTKGYERVEVSDFEARQNKSVPTIETVEALKDGYEHIYLIIGADNVSGLPRWDRYEELKQLVTFVVATRSGYDIPSGFEVLSVDVGISSTDIKSRYFKKD